VNRSSNFMLSSGIWSPASPPLSASSDAAPLSVPSACVRDWTCHQQCKQSLFVHGTKTRTSDMEMLMLSCWTTPGMPDKLVMAA